MSLEQQQARIAEAPTGGWVLWLSYDAYKLVRLLLEAEIEDDGDPVVKRIAQDILEGTY